MRLTNTRIIVLGLIVLCIGLAVPARGETLKIVTTTTDLASLATTVGGDKVDVQAIVPGGFNADLFYHDNAFTGLASKQGLLQCKEIPTAFLRIKRSAFEKIQKPYFKIGSNEKDFGEDIYFCRKWIASGNFMWIDCDISFTHRGGRVWKGNFYDYALKAGLLIKQDAA